MIEIPTERHSAAVTAAVMKLGKAVPATEQLGFHMLGSGTVPQRGFHNLDAQPAIHSGFVVLNTGINGITRPSHITGASGETSSISGEDSLSEGAGRPKEKPFLKQSLPLEPGKQALLAKNSHDESKSDQPAQEEDGPVNQGGGQRNIPLAGGRGGIPPNPPEVSLPAGEPEEEPSGEAAFPSPEKREKVQEIRIGEFFSLFPPEYTKKITREDKPAQFNSFIFLVTPSGERLRFLVTADNGFAEPEHPIIAPFRTETGYRIDLYDFDEVAGPYKLHQWFRSFQPGTSDQLPLHIINSHPEDYDDPPISDTAYQKLDKLQLQVFADDLLVQANNEKGDAPDEPKMTFRTFYPMDTGPLPYLPDGGFRVCLPDDLLKLQTVRARFILPE